MANKDYAAMTDEELAKELKGIPIELIAEAARRGKGESKMRKALRHPTADLNNDDPRLARPM
jgi:hypothetical protein